MKAIEFVYRLERDTCEMQMKPIKSFKGDYGFLSNFSKSRLTFEGIRYPTVEHAFQAAKTTDRKGRLIISTAYTAGKAKRLGRKVTLRDDWEDIKVDVMRSILTLKFADKELADRLLATGTAELQEGNNWDDRFWGVCKGSGQNMLGKLLMEIREEIEG